MKSSCLARPARPLARKTSTAALPKASSASPRWLRPRWPPASPCAAPSSCTVGCPYQGEYRPGTGRLLGRVDEGHWRAARGCGRHDWRGQPAVGAPGRSRPRSSTTTWSTSAATFDDTYGQALSSTLAGVSVGVWNFQSSVSGLGGCPYAKGATGNVATEDVVFMLHGMAMKRALMNSSNSADAGQYISDLPGPPQQARAWHGRALAKRLG